MPFKARLTIGLLALAGTLALLAYVVRHREPPVREHARLYWLVPDGLRADPELFDIFQWAESGELPGIQRMMREGAYGFSIPVFSSHSPMNFASLFTGTYPDRHGVVDGPIRAHSQPLATVTRSGFSALAKLVDPLWYTLEQHDWKVTLLSVPGSTPPELQRGEIIKGRWGGWGQEHESLILQSGERHDFEGDEHYTRFLNARAALAWTDIGVTHSPAREIEIGEFDLFALITDSTDDRQENYDTISFSRDKKTKLLTLKAGTWSEWFKLDDRLARVKAIKLGARDFFRIRVLFDGLNQTLATPASLSRTLHSAAGPMVDYADHFPPQLIYFDEDRATFQEESKMSFEWHRKAAGRLAPHADAFVQAIYTPNQMLTSRWWMSHLDPRSKRYHEVDEKKRAELWREVREMYREVDRMILDALEKLGPDDVLVVSSDHGAVPLNAEVQLNNLFARKGWLKFRERHGTFEVDWSKTKVVFLKTNHIYINPRGLAGPYTPAQGAAYERLRDEVMQALRELRDADGIAPLKEILKREEATAWRLPQDKIGDLVIASRAGYLWSETMSQDLKIFASTLKGGYKQGTLPDEKGLWTPFLIVGPGIKKGFRIKEPIQIVDQYPTVLRALKLEAPYAPDGRVLEEIF